MDEFEVIVLDRHGVPIDSFPGFGSLEAAVEEAEYQADHMVDTAKVEIVDQDSQVVRTVRPRSAVR